MAPADVVLLDQGTAPDTQRPPEDAPSPDASEPDAQMLPEAGPDAARTALRGTLTVSEADNPGGGVGRSINVSFGSFPAPSCTQRTEGACTVQRCTITSSEEALDSRLSGASAGDVQVQVGASTNTTLRPDGDNNYSFLLAGGATRLWMPGDAVTVTAAGATVPAFSFTSALPPVIDGTVGEVSGIGTVIDRSMPLVARWTARGTSGQVAVIVSQGGGVGSAITYPIPRVRLTCVYPVAAGSATIPVSILGDLLADDRAGSPPLSSSAWVEGLDRQTMNAGGYALTLEVSTGSSGHFDATVR